MRMHGMTFGAIAAGILAFAAGRAAPSPEKAGDGLVVHEWGTFLSVQGSDGVAVGGMVESEDLLPAFVERRDLQDSLRRSAMRQKMETPVTYFYTDRPLEVEVRVDMDGGMLTHWFPTALWLDAGEGKPGPARTRSSIDWGKIRLLPAGEAPGAFPVRDPGADSPWRFAREVDAAYVKVSRGEEENGALAYDHERFLFYRGLGEFELPLSVTSRGPDDALEIGLANLGDAPIRGIHVVRVAGGAVDFAALDDLSARESRAISLERVLERGCRGGDAPSAVKDAVSRSLVRARLYEKEAQAMVNTWERGYFGTEGLRVLYVVPRSRIDELLPLTVRPAPAAVERVMVGRIEVLTPDRERKVERAVADMGRGAPDARGAARRFLESMGRYAEPALRRVSESTRDPEVARLAASLIEEHARRG